MTTTTQKKIPQTSFLSVLAAGFQTQLSIALGMLFSLIVSLFYYFQNDPRFPQEKPEILFIGFSISMLFFGIGTFIAKKNVNPAPISIKQGAQIVLLTWVLATLTSAFIFVLAGFPIPGREGDFSLFRRFSDGIFESISGYTTAGGSILPSVEVFPRGILMWRSVTHLLGGMGLAYLAVTIWKRIAARREQIINSEAESPHYVDFKNEEEARLSGFDFMKIYGLITGIMIVLMFISGALFRQTPYETWYDNAFDAVNYAFSTMGTGGFGTYDTSAGLPLTTSEGTTIIGGLRNPVSEWIIGIFMMVAGANLSLWYILAFNIKKWKDVFTNKEFITYCCLVFGLTFSIWAILIQHSFYPNIWDALRYSFFNVNTIFSTTGLGNTNFHLWPGGAIGILFIAYLMGGMAGSTAGGLKTIRFVVFFRYMWMKIQNLVYGRHMTRLKIDGIAYNEKQVGFILVNIILYYIIFLLGAVTIMVVSPQVTLADGTVKNIDLISGITASIANLGNIGPTASLGSIDAGPSGNYSAFSDAAKLVMSLLMFIGRIGVLSFLMLFITGIGSKQVEDTVVEKHFDKDEPMLLA